MSTDPQKSTTDVAADQARYVAAHAKDNASGVAGTAKEQGQALLSETSYHARTLLDQARSELTQQAGTQQGRLGDVLRTLATELQEMAGASASSGGMAAGLVGDVASRTDGAARWLDERQPAEVLDEVRRFARRKPGTFLATAALVGFVGGRLTRGLTAQDDEPRALAAGPAGYQPGYQPGYEAAHRTATYDPAAYAEHAYPVDQAAPVVPSSSTPGEPFDQYAAVDPARHATDVETSVEDPATVTFDGTTDAR